MLNNACDVRRWQNTPGSQKYCIYGFIPVSVYICRTPGRCTYRQVLPRRRENEVSDIQRMRYKRELKSERRKSTTSLVLMNTTSDCPLGTLNSITDSYYKHHNGTLEKLPEPGVTERTAEPCLARGKIFRRQKERQKKFLCPVDLKPNYVRA